MFPTEDKDGHADADSVGNLDTLTAEDALPNASLDDSLLRRDLKSRIFGSSSKVHIGRYEILRRIGRGGMGTVYVGHDPELDRKVALKVLRADRRSGRERMLHEARALARLSHPNVVTVHEVGVHDDRVFVAMELIEGLTLRSWLERSPERSELFAVFAQAARGLQAAHRAGLVHRDFKPENILIGDDGRVRVVDFGVVKATDSLDGDAEARVDRIDPATALPDLTLTGQLLGTPAYMAAEQFLGTSVDARTDVFAFCVTLYESLAGHRPFVGDNFGEVSRAVLEGTVPSLDVPDIPEPIATLIERGLSRDAGDRPDSDELVVALDQTQAPRPPRRSWLRWVAGATLATAGALTLTAAGLAFLFVQRPPEPAAAALVDAMTTGEGEGVEIDGEHEAFTRIVSSSDEVRRHAAAEQFLEHYGDSAAPARRAIAHSIIGDAQWRASCPKAMLGLCVEEQPTQANGYRCMVTSSGPLQPLPRDKKKAESAREHLELALGLAGVEPPEDPSERELFSTAIGRARVQRTDAKLEQYLAIEMPKGLDFIDANTLSSEAFTAYFTRGTQRGKELLMDYAAVKKTGANRWVLVAAARTGILSEKFGIALGSAPLPENLDEEQRRAYCKVIEQYTLESLQLGRSAYTYCVTKADEFGVEQPVVEYCRERLGALEQLE